MNAIWNEHLYYDYPNDGKDYGCKSLKHPVFKKHTIFDVKGVGGQVVAPGSIHPDTGKEYCITKDMGTAPLPKWLMEYVQGKSLNIDCLKTIPPCKVSDKIIQSAPLHEKTKEMILAPQVVGERSEKSFAVLKDMIRTGLHENLIRYVFDNYPIGEKYREKGASSYNWLTDEIRRAKGKSYNSRDAETDDFDDANHDPVTDQATFIEFASIIEAKDSTADAAYLSCVLTHEIFQAALPKTMEHQLLKMISKKCGIPVGMLTSQKSNDANLQDKSQIKMVQDVIEEIDRSNIFFACEFVWQWSETGVWQKVEDRHVKSILQEKVKATGGDVSKNLINSMLDIFKTEIYSPGQQFNIGPAAVNCLNCEIHWTGEKWEQKPHCKESYRTTQIPVVADPNATAPLFDKFLGEITQTDADVSFLICEMFGYCLLPTTEFEKFFMLTGRGANGKSVLLYVLIALLGRENVSAVNPSQLDNKFQRAHLLGKLANIVTELPEGCQLPDEQMKTITSGELMTAEMKFKPPFDFEPFSTLVFATNHLPQVRDFSEALFRRAVVIEFTRIFKEPEQDKGLSKKLIKELPGILNIALEAMAGVFQRGHFTEATSVNDMKAQWRLESDQAAQFVQDCCEWNPNYRETSQEIYSLYRSWAASQGVGNTLNQTNFIKRLKALGAGTVKGTAGRREIAGLQMIKTVDAF